ncbi:hypothetical protein VP01_690g4 [Puccinia sorghi]|uniref:Uncharacterized protein n=1 Tax=Puccinia sorghi TaxID=27349 RepID=A0A0L6UE74_9BASI|nr:hypothetical protein VP01_690g4 [Puccinia sorghi]
MWSGRVVKKKFQNDLAEWGHEPILNCIPNQNQNVIAGHPQLMKDYLNKDVTYNERDFKCCSWVKKSSIYPIVP